MKFSQSKRIGIILLIAVILLTVIFIFMKRSVDTLYFNARIYTLDDKNSVANAIVVKGGRIIDVGKEQRLRALYRASQEVDLKGRTVLPAFIDAHCHLLELGLSKLAVDLFGSNSEAEAAERVANYLHSAPLSQEWIRGKGWDQNLWDIKKFPTSRSLDLISKEHPIYLARIDGHACWVNSKAMEIAHVTKRTPEPEGGRILRDANGNPTGVFVDEAMKLIADYVPPPSEEEIIGAIQKASEEYLSYGVASVQDMAIDENQFSLYKKLIGEKKLPLRIYASVDVESNLWKEFQKSKPLIGYGENALTVRAVKIFLDGALGSRGAALLEPYSDEPDNRGITTLSADSLESLVKEAVESGFQVCIHAIGDRANRIALEAYESVQAKKDSDLRLRIEHAQVLQESDIPRFAKLKVIPSMQPVQCISDMWWIESRLGYPRVKLAYPWRSLLNTGSIIAGGSDAPVESPNPILGIYAACTRKSVSGIPHNAKDAATQFYLTPDGIHDSSDFEDGWYGAQKMTREEAVRCFTSWAAYAAFEENLKGSLKSNMLADFVVLSDDIFTVPVEQIPDIFVEETVIGGKNVYHSERK